MKKTLTLTIAFVVLTLFAVAQNQRYSRVKIFLDEEGMKKLASLEISSDHGFYKKGLWFIGEFSEDEISRVANAGYKYELLIDDLKKHYKEQNNVAAAEKIMAPPGCADDCALVNTPSNFALGSMGGFFTYQEVLDNLDSMAVKYPTLITPRSTVGPNTTYEGRNLFTVKISDNPGVNESEPEVLFTSLHHAREAESISQLIFYMWHLLENYGTDPEITYLLNNLEIYFIPCVNPDGYLYNESTDPNGGGMWRKNRFDNGDGTFGVDLNRNYAQNWGFDNFGSSPNTNNDTYRGTAPFSEAETQLVRDFCNLHTFKLAINNHTYGNYLIHPWGFIADSLTLDSVTFTSFGDLMTHCSKFNSGTANQTVGYSANGSSDDWMYGEQSSKPKILAFTPEAGDQTDGFWPIQSRIIPIAKNTIDQNLFALRLVANYAEAKERYDYFANNLNGFVKFDFQRVGLEPGNYSVSLVPITANILSVGSPKIYLNPIQFTNSFDSISFSLNPATNPGDIIKFILKVNNGFYDREDTITRVFGTPILAFNDNCNTLASWTNAGWGTTTSSFVSATASITDSPGGDYATNSSDMITTTAFINLTNAIAAELSFYAQWKIESGWDYVQVMASSDGINFAPLCGQYTKPGGGFQDPGNPLYDGFQNSWVKESVDLSGYLGQNIKIRFQLISDGGLEYDGYYFDDLKVNKIVNTVGLNAIEDQAAFSLFPNPAQEQFTVQLKNIKLNEEIVIEMFDALGNVILKKKTYAKSEMLLVDISGVSQGVYFVKISGKNIQLQIKKLVVNH